MYHKHTSMHPCIHLYNNIYMNYIHIRYNIYIHITMTHVRACIHTNTQTLSHSLTHSPSHTLTHSHTYTHPTRAHTHAVWLTRGGWFVRLQTLRARRTSFWIPLCAISCGILVRSFFYTNFWIPSCAHSCGTVVCMYVFAWFRACVLCGAYVLCLCVRARVCTRKYTNTLTSLYVSVFTVYVCVCVSLSLCARAGGD